MGSIALIALEFDYYTVYKMFSSFLLQNDFVFL